MRKYILISLAIIAIAAALIAGASSAWFTAVDDAGEATFTAGTVDIEAGNAEILPGTFYENWAPGDSEEVEWMITNPSSTHFHVSISSV